MEKILKKWEQQKKLLIVFFLLSLSIKGTILSKEDSSLPKHKELMKQAKEEAKELGKKGQEELASLLKASKGEKNLSDLQQELLPTDDLGKEFNADLAAKKVDTHQTAPSEQEVEKFLSTTIKKEELEGEENLFSEARKIVQNPQLTVGIATETTTSVPEEEEIRFCQEPGNYEITLLQDKKVKIISEVKERKVTCLGHEKTTSFFLEKNAHKEKEHQKKKLSKRPDVEWFNVEVKKGHLFKDYTLTIAWKHKEGTSCDKQKVEEKVLQPRKEEEYWETDQIDLLHMVQNNPLCHLLYEKTTQGPSSRPIEGETIYRDVWQRRLFFICGGTEDSKCKTLRSLGGVLVFKKCIKENDFGQCDLFEKAYDIGKKGACQNKILSFEKEEIWGLSEEFDPSYEKNKDFAQVATTFSIFSDITNEMQPKNFDQNTSLIFNGNSSKCQRGFAKQVLYDCCRSLEGLAVDAHLACCTEEEQALARKRKEGKCHYVGSKKTKMGLETQQIFCCFPTKLARIFQEEGRKQLGLDWGKAEKPNCSGLTLQQLQLLDFSKMDLSELIEDLAGKINKEELLRKMEGIAQSFQLEGARTNAQCATERAIQEQEKKTRGENK
ncbi:MAG: conjugal transfer protein TraN [Simkania negevensis]|nr:conjugal transfer protein TraN [Simkania negevensis]